MNKYFPFQKCCVHLCECVCVAFVFVTFAYVVYALFVYLCVSVKTCWVFLHEFQLSIDQISFHLQLGTPGACSDGSCTHVTLCLLTEYKLFGESLHWTILDHGRTGASVST